MFTEELDKLRLQLVEQQEISARFERDKDKFASMYKQEKIDAGEAQARASALEQEILGLKAEVGTYKRKSEFVASMEGQLGEAAEQIVQYKEAVEKLLAEGKRSQEKAAKAGAEAAGLRAEVTGLLEEVEPTRALLAALSKREALDGEIAGLLSKL